MTRDVEADNEKLHALVESSNRILEDLEEQLPTSISRSR